MTARCSYPGHQAGAKRYFIMLQALESCALVMDSFGHHVYGLGLVRVRYLYAFRSIISDDWLSLISVRITELVQGRMKRSLFFFSFF